MTTPAELYAPFRPRWARYVAIVLAVLLVAGFFALIWGMSAVGSPMEPGDIGGVAVFALILIWFCFRQATVRAVPSSEGLVVRNLFITTRLTWPQIIAVHLGDRPWAQLDLADGDTLSVMGIQSADGDFARQEARRLATLVAANEPRDR
ncbi:MAG TPA: PH domain-containing protein [Actinomycetaceae bacterium]|nr:PH domain-containing protein [Actinomycetaceae bacterium]